MGYDNGNGTAKVRKYVTVVEETIIEGGKEAPKPVRIACAMAVVTNPFSGRFVDDLKPLVNAYSEKLGTELAQRAIAALNITGEQVEAFGKGALVGLDGEIEHGSCIIHTMTFGNPFRKLCGNAETLLPSAEKRGAAGSPIDIPLKHKMDARIRSHHMTLEVRIPDAPRSDEIVIIAAVSDNGRPHSRSGSLLDELKAMNK